MRWHTAVSPDGSEAGSIVVTVGRSDYGVTRRAAFMTTSEDDAMSDADAVRAEAGLPDDDSGAWRADEALGNALVGLVQDHLARVSDHWDVDLFFETYGRPPRDGGSWSQAIINGLAARGLPEQDRRSLIEESKCRAVRRLTTVT